MINAVQRSSSLYKEELAKLKAARDRYELEQKIRDKHQAMESDLLKNEEDLLRKQKDLQRQQEELTKLISDGSTRLQAAIKSKDSLNIDAATILIDGANVKNQSLAQDLAKVTEELFAIQRRRKDSFAHREKSKKVTL